MSIVPTRSRAARPDRALRSAPLASSPRRRRRLLATALLVAVLALVGAACQQLDPNNRAAPVPAVTNGAIPLAYLASTGNGCVVYDEALPSLQAMIALAAKDGINLRPVSCYRDYAGQVATRASWCGRGACQFAAVPGTSNHGWGKAVDFADGSGTLEFGSRAYEWMKAWAGFYGWIHPASLDPGTAAPEAWHWEWIGDGGKMFNGQYFGIGNAVPAVPRGLPIGSLDVVTPVPGGVSVAGWAIDPDQVEPIPVHVYIDSSGVPLTANTPRSDVEAAYPLYAKRDHGFSANLLASPGTHQVCAYAINMSGSGYNRQLGCVTVTVPPAAPATAAALEPPAPPPTTSPPTSTAPSTTTTTVPKTTAPTTTTIVPSSSTTTSTSTSVPAPNPSTTSTTATIPRTTVP